MQRHSAFIFDMNGTMIDDMHYHEIAWHDVLVNQLKAPLTLEQVRRELYGKADEMFDRIFGPGVFSKEEIEKISINKESKYRQDFLPHLKLIDGLDELLREVQLRGILMAIGTAAPPENVDFVLDNLALRKYFRVVIGAEDVAHSKPHPEVFLKAAAALGCPPGKCVVFEDSPKGIQAAANAGMNAVAVTSFHTKEELSQNNVLLTIHNYEDFNLDLLA